jgi:hypothetical protein
MEGSPKKWAHDISEGLLSVNAVSLKRVPPPDMKLMWVNLQGVLKEVRAIAVPEGDFAALKAKNMKMTRLNQAMMILNAYARKNKVAL